MATGDRIVASMDGDNLNIQFEEVGQVGGSPVYALVVVGGASALPTGAATAAKQDTQITGLASLLAAVDGLEGFTDGLEALLGTGNTSLASILAAQSSSAAAVTNQAASASSAQFLAVTAGRKGLLIFNDCDKALFLKYGATASATSFTVKIAAGGYWEMPSPIFTGRIDGIWEADPTGSARLTELT